MKSPPSTGPLSEHPNFRCQLCPKTFHSKVNFNAHLKIHATASDYTCLSCVPPKEFGKRGRFMKHFDAIHGRLSMAMPAGVVQIFICDVCKEHRFISKEKLEVHLGNCYGPQMERRTVKQRVR